MDAGCWLWLVLRSFGRACLTWFQPAHMAMNWGGPVERRRRQDLSSRNEDYGDFLLVVGGVDGSEWPFITRP